MINLNMTLIGQMITFALFVWFTMRFVWPPIMSAMQERQNKIAEGLSAAEQGVKELELAEYKSKDILMDAKTQATKIIEQANHRAVTIIEESKNKAHEEGERLMKMAQEDIQQEYSKAKEELTHKVSGIAMAASQKILQREIDAAANADIVNDLVREL